MKKLLLIALMATTLSGCGYFERITATTTGFSRMCVDGVQYIQFTSGATVAYNKDGSVKGC